MARTLVVAAVVSAAALLGCKGRPQMDLPVYPGSGAVAGNPNVEEPHGTLFRARRETPDGARTVAAFYRKELAEGRGWSETQSVGPAFTDGNLTVDRPGQGTQSATPIDPSRPGGFVVVYEVYDTTVIEAWQWIPAPAR